MALLGNPFIANEPKQMSDKELAQAIRVDIAGEIEAVIAYEAHTMATGDERVKKVLQEIANEEKRHVGQLEEVLYMLSPNDSQFIEEGKQKIKDQQSNDKDFHSPMSNATLR